MAITLEDAVKMALERLAPSQTTLFERPLLNLILPSREGMVFVNFADDTGTPFFMVGFSVVGTNFVVS